MDASEHLEFYNVFLAVEEQETLRLLRNIRLAANVVRAADMRHHFGPAKEKSKSSEPRIVTTQSELEFPASLVVFGFFDVRLALLVDYVELAPAEKYRLVAMVRHPACFLSAVPDFFYSGIICYLWLNCSILLAWNTFYLRPCFR